MNVLVGCLAIELFASGTPDLQIVPENGPFEYDKVPFSNLVAGKKIGIERDELHEKLKDFFANYSGAKNAARVAKALFIPAVAHLRKQPWSLILTHILYREADRSLASTDFGGVASGRIFENCHGLNMFKHPFFL